MSLNVLSRLFPVNHIFLTISGQGNGWWSCSEVFAGKDVTKCKPSISRNIREVQIAVDACMVKQYDFWIYPWNFIGIIRPDDWIVPWTCLVLAVSVVTEIIDKRFWLLFHNREPWKVCRTLRKKASASHDCNLFFKKLTNSCWRFSNSVDLKAFNVT